MGTPTTQPAGRQSIVSSRYSPPRTLEALVERPALLSALLTDASGKITVLAGPHGCGKTSLLMELCRACANQGLEVRWLNLTPEDNQAELLRRHLLSAFGLPQVSEGEGLPDLPEGTVAFIDGLEHLTSPVAHALAEWFMLSLPVSSMLFTTATRLRGSLLHSARLRGLVKIVGTERLRLNVDEARQLLGCDYTVHEISYLTSFMDGWAAGLRFLQRNRDCCRRLLSSRSDDVLPAEMLDYFDEQFAAKLPADILEALTQLSAFERFTPLLLAAMPDPPCTWQLVEEQIFNGLILDYADERREWVAFHPAFSLYLRHRLRCRAPARYEELKLFAAQSLLAEGHHAEAAHHATGLSCTPTAARIIEEAGGITVQAGQGRNTTLDELIAPQQAGELPLLFISQLYQRIRCGRFREAQAAFDEAWLLTEGFTRIEPGSDSAVVQAWAYQIDFVLRVTADQPDYNRHQERLEADLHRHLEHAPVLAASIASVLGFGYVDQTLYDQALRACALGMQLQSAPEENRVTVFVLLHRTSAQLAVESVAQAQSSSEEALRLACSDGVSDSYEVLSAQMIRALVHYEQGELDVAQRLLLPALEQVRVINGWMRLYAEAFSTAAAIAGSREGLAAAEQIIRAGERFASERQYHRLAQFMAIAQLRELCRAQQWSDAMLLVEGDTLQVLLQAGGSDAYTWVPKLHALLVIAQLQLEMGRPHECLAYLDRLVVDCPLRLDNRQQVALELLSMRARFALRRFNACHEHFQRAVALLRQGGYVQRALEARPYLLEMFNWSRRQGRSLLGGLDDWLRNILQPTPEDEQATTFDRVSRLAANYHLSPRETEIISLVAEGYINKEIAAMLGISEGTVKGHRKSVHEKLGVTSRSQAISRARELMII
jgi:LuxR family maltose regulon positive regulatory protein